MKRFITLSNPKQKTIKLLETEVTNETAYGLVELIRGKKSNALEIKTNKFAEIKIEGLFPIHNLSGIRDFNQIEKMQTKIKNGKEILEQDNLPNIKLIVAPNDKILVFDGTHSLLAYFLEGKKYLKEIPYLIIAAENYQAVTTDELLPFYPETDKSKLAQDWEKYVVNWQAPKGNQLELREVNSIAQLVSQFRKRNKSSIEK